jgi:multimeric flavodoxin WrbA
MKISVVYHSGYGHTAEQAKAVLRGVQSVTGIEGVLISVADVESHWDTLKESAAIIFGCPTYMGTVSGDFKKFMDASSKAWHHGDWKDKLAAGFTNSASQNGDKLNSLITLVLFAAQHGMTWVNLGLPPGNNSSKGSVEDLNRLGSFIGAMAQSHADQGPDVGPIPSDLRTAEHLGTRVATLAKRFK